MSWKVDITEKTPQDALEFLESRYCHLHQEHAREYAQEHFKRLTEIFRQIVAMAPENNVLITIEAAGHTNGGDGQAAIIKWNTSKKIHGVSNGEITTEQQPPKFKKVKGT